MSSALYNRDILRLATAIPHLGRLEFAEGTVDRRSPTCGSRVTVDVTVDEEGRVDAIGLEVSACALGQASASLMSAHAIGKTAPEFSAAAAALRSMLSAQADDPDVTFWPGIAVLLPARAHPARHASILLAFDAASEATAIASEGKVRV